jgi:protein TonB
VTRRVCSAGPPNDLELSPAARCSLVAGILAAHAGGAWALLQLDAVRAAVADVAPLMVELLAPPAQVPAPPAPPPSPAPPQQLRKPPPKVIAAPAPRAPAPPAFMIPAPPPEPPAPPPEVVAAAPPAVPEPAPEPAPVSPPPPKTVEGSAVQYLDPPAPTYPAASRRFGESGRVFVRVLIDERGLPRQLQLQRSSGFERLDDAALAAIRAARFRPYTEDGRALVVWAVIPIHFELE